MEYSIYNNLAPHFLSGEWELNANATAESAKRLVLNATALDQFSRVVAYVRAGSTFVIKGEITGNARVRISKNNSTNAIGGTWIADFTGGEKEIVVPTDTEQIVLAFGQKAGVGAGVYILENLLLQDPTATADYYINMNPLKIDWLPSDYYHSDDLNRVEKTTEYVRDRLYDNTGELIVLDLNPNLVPVPDKSEGFTPNGWYSNLSYEVHTFKSGRIGFRGTMVDVATNPRYRLVGAYQEIYNVPLVEGRTYTYSVIFQPSRDLIKVEFASVYYYRDVATGFWENFPAEDINNLPIESEIDGTYRYEVTFIAQATSRIRPSFGFGLSNPNIQNGSYCNVVEFRIKEVLSEKNYPFADNLNRIESNLGELRSYLHDPYETLTPRTTWTSNQPFSYSDSNRLERNLQYTYNHSVTKAHSVPRCGQYTLTKEIGVL